MTGEEDADQKPTQRLMMNVGCFAQKITTRA
jgi:hypothetical protein